MWVFRIVIKGGGTHSIPFMASIIIFSLVLGSVLIAAEVQQRQFNVSLGSSLTPTTKNSSWVSPSGLYAFGFYPQGNGYAVGVFLAGIPQKTVVWTASRDDPPVPGDVTLLFSRDSGLVLQSAQGQNTSIVSPTESASSASFFDSGNFVLYNSNQQIIWQSFGNPTDTLLPAQRLQAETQLVSSVSETDKSTGIFRIKMQNDGNLVQYPVKTPDTADYAYWASGTDGSGKNVTLNLDPDGHLYLLNATGANIRDLSRGGNPSNETVYLAKMDADGIFRLYSYNLSQNGNWSIAWPSMVDKCLPKGLCGLNSYCVSNDPGPRCICLPGFDFVDQGNWFSGCERDFVAESCKEKNVSAKYSIEPLAYNVWEENSYSTLLLASNEDCEEACQEDCNCEAVFYKDAKCRKQRLPLKFGRKDTSDSNSAFIKVGRSISISDPGMDRIEPRDKRTSKKNIKTEILIVSISCVSSVLVMLAIFALVVHSWHLHAYKTIDNDNVTFYEQVSIRSFTYAELVDVTNGFQEEIGRGSFGTVYKGLISESQKLVAVKRLDRVLDEGEREFQNEIKVIAKTHHKNLVCLFGYCIDGPNRLLVYQYMSNGSLADVLFSPEKRLNFTERLEIARNIARGILYLHEECETQIIHCDIKPQNILMDEHWCPKISDFGLAKLMKPDQTKTFTAIRGTRGYVAPEWHRNLPVTAKADVYSFGVVLLEVICGRRNLERSLPETEAILEEWVYNCFEAGELEKLVGEEEEVDRRQLDRMVKVGIWCTLDEPSLRPSMKKVLLMMEGTVDIPTPPSPTSFLSTM